MLAPQPHLLHPMKSTRVPRRFVFLDTEAHRQKRRGAEEQTWRLGVTGATHWDSKAGQWSPLRLEDHATPGDLWDRIEGEARASARTVVVAHNLAYDLRIADGLEIMGRRGWTAERLVIAPDQVALDLVQGDLRLVLVDSVSVLPASLASLGERLGMHKTALPAESAPDAEHLARCRADVTILARAYLAVVDALRLGDLGCWARSGSGIGWNTMLRRHLAGRVLVHADDEIRAVELEAAYSGRCEAWRWGKARGGPFTLWDHELAYANILADEVLPAYLRDRVIRPRLEDIARRYPAERFLVHAEVATDAPVLPTRDEHGIYWPVGTFAGWWWDVELITAAAEGASIRCIEAWRYEGRPWLQTWGSWVLDLCADDTTPEARVLAIAAKHWQRAMVGRSAMRWRDWSPAGSALRHGVHYEPAHDLDTGADGAAFEMGGRRWESWARPWADNAVPFVLSAVMAHGRVRLWQDMRTAGLDHVVYVDTDALVTDPVGSARIAAALEAGELGSLRRKAVLRAITIDGPRQVTSTAYTRLAGVPTKRRRVARNVYVAETWETFTTSLEGASPSTVRVRDVTITTRGTDWRRLHLEGGETAAYAVEDGTRVTDAGGVELAG